MGREGNAQRNEHYSRMIATAGSFKTDLTKRNEQMGAGFDLPGREL
jgi:hypothetical protein